MADTLSNMENGGLIAAVDGPSGTGKSTMCRALAKRLDAKYVDTGAMYRVATLAVLRAGVDPADTAKVIEATADLPLQVSDDPDAGAVRWGGGAGPGGARAHTASSSTAAGSSASSSAWTSRMRSNDPAGKGRRRSSTSRVRFRPTAGHCSTPWPPGMAATTRRAPTKASSHGVAYPTPNTSQSAASPQASSSRRATRRRAKAPVGSP